MIYNNLIYFLVAIFLFSMATTPIKPELSGYLSISAFVVLLAVFNTLVGFIFNKADVRQTAGYFKAERRSALTALLVFSLMVFGFDLKYHLSFLSIHDSFPALVNIGGMVVFLLLFVLIWRKAKKSYERVFARKYSSSVFIFSNLRANLPIVIPWMILTLCYDLVKSLPWPWLQEIIDTSWGDVLFFSTFLIFIFIFFPPLVKRLWGCKKLEEGDLRNHLKSFCERQNFSAELYIWPLFEGRVITAGVMGLFPGLRYILITPALLETMSIEELDSVMAHEIGHVKRFHLPLYVFLIGSFVLTGGFLAEPLFVLFFSKDYFYDFVSFTGFSPEILRHITVALPALLLLLFFFRFVFGYFMRNFERQADLHVFPVLGNSDAIISTFEKIAILSGNIRDQPSWHHFGIGQRVEFLKLCERYPATIRRHHRKVGLSLIAYLAIIFMALFFIRGVSLDSATVISEDKYTRVDLLYDASKEENPAHWLFFAGNYFIKHKLEKRAIIAFELAMKKDPNQPELLNNFSWLLLTSAETDLRDPKKALTLAQSAVLLKQSGHVLDTLATAWWANGYPEEAVEVEKEAILADPAKADYYLSQIERFKVITYQQEVEDALTKDAHRQSTTSKGEQG